MGFSEELQYEKQIMRGTFDWRLSGRGWAQGPVCLWPSSPHFYSTSGVHQSLRVAQVSFEASAVKRCPYVSKGGDSVAGGVGGVGIRSDGNSSSNAPCADDGVIVMEVLQVVLVILVVGMRVILGTVVLMVEWR